jgi:putative transposase
MVAALRDRLMQQSHLELATVNWVHWFNQHHRHSGLGYRPPVEYENLYYRHINPRQQPLAG